MQEGTVTTGGTIINWYSPFSYWLLKIRWNRKEPTPLPEAQLDRFMFKIQVPFLIGTISMKWSKGPS